MSDLSSPQGRIGLAILLLVVLGLGYLLWSRSAPPVPQPAPGQSLATTVGCLWVCDSASAAARGTNGWVHSAPLFRA